MASRSFFCIFLAIGANAPYATSRTHDFGFGLPCALGYFPCGNITKCLPQALHCNGIDDCGNQADEDNCGDNNGWSEQLDKYYALYHETFSRSVFEVETYECLLDSVPAECLCHGLELVCDDANLHNVPSVSSDVTMMSLKWNLLRSLVADGFKKYQDLKNLYLQNNKISTVSLHAFRGLYNLTKLYLSHNNITFLETHVFEDLHKLEWLIINDNKIKSISPLTFYGLKSLILLVLMNNSLTHLPDKHLCQHMPRLNWLDFEGNQIHDLRNGSFITCRHLTVLVLRRNNISSLKENSFSTLQRLVELNLSYNPIQKIHADQFDYLIKLNSLSLDGIEITNIQRRMFIPLRNLSHIYFKKFQYCGYAPHVRCCKPNTDGISSFENLLASIIQRVFVWVVSAVTCFGNIFVICTRPYIQSENKLHALSIMSLCCADCLMGIYLFVIGVFDLKYRGEYNKHARLWIESVHCQLVGSLAILSTEVSVLLLTYLTLEKYICIVYPFRFMRPGKYKTISILGLIWIIGFVVAFTPLINKDFFQNYYGTNGVCFPLHSEQSENTGAQIYSVVIFLGVNLVAFIIIVFSYGSMFYSVHKTAITAMEIQNHVKKEMTLAKRFFFIVFTDALCWIPIFILKLLSLLQVEIPGSITSWVVIFILPINSALNPILYTLTTRPFKEMINQAWHNYKQRRSPGSKSSQKMCGPSFIWVEMWPIEDISSELTKSAPYRDSLEGSVNTLSARLDLHT
ncbi:relaxin receptor 1 isoform X2 [Hemicordylus capensis]|uniref:relaxin receptor 1 isoform X2 n=1 Tax=Hemicordylus capensis TaxID=884348 RepID=UPI002304630C|nr:relaxin receptor 1 isoform X2 [Hemicordylus capensis]